MYVYIYIYHWIFLNLNLSNMGFFQRRSCQHIGFVHLPMGYAMVCCTPPDGPRRLFFMGQTCLLNHDFFFTR